MGKRRLTGERRKICNLFYIVVTLRSILLNINNFCGADAKTVETKLQ